MKKIKVAVNGYGVIGKRVANAVTLQDDMELMGVCDVITDWRIRMAEEKKYPVFAFDETARNNMKEADGLAFRIANTGRIMPKNN